MKKLSMRAKQGIRKINYDFNHQFDYFTSHSSSDLYKRLKNMKGVGPTTRAEITAFYHHLRELW